MFDCNPKNAFENIYRVLLAQNIINILFKWGGGVEGPVVLVGAIVVATVLGGGGDNGNTKKLRE